MQKARLRKGLGMAARLWLLLIALFWCGFALLSGAERHGGGIAGVIKNIPNALPWLLLLAVALLCFRWPLIGALGAGLFGLFSLVQYDAYASPFLLLTITLPLLLACLLLFLTRPEKGRAPKNKRL